MMKERAPLPFDNADALERVLKPYRPLAVPMVQATSKILGFAGQRLDAEGMEFDSDESESLTLCASGVMYEEGINLNMKWMLLICVASITTARIPIIIDALERRREARREKKVSVEALGELPKAPTHLQPAPSAANAVQAGLT